MEDLKAKQIVHRVIDNSLSGIQDDPWMAQRVLNTAHQTQGTGGFSMMRSKKKLIVLIALICIALMGTIGLAWSLSREYFADVAQITLNSGDYASWSLEEKRYMMTIMGKYGLVSEAEAEKLSRQSEDEIDAFMLERYGFEPGPEGLSTISLIGIAAPTRCTSLRAAPRPITGSSRAVSPVPSCNTRPRISSPPSLSTMPCSIRWKNAAPRSRFCPFTKTASSTPTICERP